MAGEKRVKEPKTEERPAAYLLAEFRVPKKGQDPVLLSVDISDTPANQMPSLPGIFWAQLDAVYAADYQAGQALLVEMCHSIRRLRWTISRLPESLRRKPKEEEKIVEIGLCKNLHRWEVTMVVGKGPTGSSGPQTITNWCRVENPKCPECGEMVMRVDRRESN